MCAAVVGVAASSFCALSLVAVYTLSPSFLTLIRDLFLGWFSLRSSFTLAAATFWLLRLLLARPESYKRVLLFQRLCFSDTQLFGD